MNLFIFGANWFNRGDESAIRAMIDELRIIYPNSDIKIQFNQNVETLPYDDITIVPAFHKPGGRNKLKNIPYYLTFLTAGTINLFPSKEKSQFQAFKEAVEWADLAIYAPGGPCIGEIYHAYFLIDAIYLTRRKNVPYVFYAPSMGPFKPYKSRIRTMLKKAELCCFREEISEGYVKELIPDLKTYVTLDSAFQHPINTQKYENEFNAYTSLKDFINRYDKVIGITISDLQWRIDYRHRDDLAEKIRKTFESFILTVTHSGYGVIFIPQLFGVDNDKNYMESFSNEHCFTISDSCDCYFQQYLISKLYAVIGMRYHSNIFSAKEGTPFISISYEHKMKGFMEKAGLTQYCIDINDLNYDLLIEKFSLLVDNYNTYKNYLNNKKNIWRAESYKTTQLVCQIVKKLNLD